MDAHGGGNGEAIRKLIGDPYREFGWRVIPSKAYQFPTSQSPMFAKYIDRTRPDLIVEVGSYTGGSTIHMAGICNADIVCIDTWLGTLDMWLKPESREALNKHNGYPTLYRQFLANVCHAGLQNRILPLPLPSGIGLRLLAAKGVKSRFIYIDGSHEAEDAYLDITLAKRLLPDDGVILVDDTDMAGVKKAIGMCGLKIIENNHNQAALCW